MHSIPAMINHIAFFIPFLLDYGSHNGNNFSLNSSDLDSLTCPDLKKRTKEMVVPLLRI